MCHLVSSFWKGSSSLMEARDGSLELSPPNPFDYATLIFGVHCPFTSRRYCMYMYISLHFSAISLLKPIQSPVATQLPERSAGSSGLGNASNNFYLIYIYIFFVVSLKSTTSTCTKWWDALSAPAIPCFVRVEPFWVFLEWTTELIISVLDSIAADSHIQCNYVHVNTVDGSMIPVQKTNATVYVHALRQCAFKARKWQIVQHQKKTCYKYTLTFSSTSTQQ